MNKYRNYKNLTLIMKLENLYNRFLSTRFRRIVFHSVAAFCGGITLAWAVLFTASNINVEKGVGGLETSSVPEYDENAEKSLDLSAEPLAENDVESDNLDAAEAVLQQDTNTSGSLELCYYTYRVKKGDMIGYIADNFGITQDTIISVNNIHQSRLIQIGQYLKIPSMPGIIYTVKKNGETAESIAEKYEVSTEKFLRVNKLEKNVSLVAGQTVFVPDAQLDWVTRQEINGDLFHKPIHTRYWLSSYFGWRSSPFSGKRSYHSGVDMACPTGTSIKASMSGTVAYASWSNVFGNYVIIKHIDGYQTLYGHMSKIKVKQGQFVSQGQEIGLVGSTGYSTGPHLHFTVYKNGKLVNPMSVLK